MSHHKPHQIYKLVLIFWWNFPHSRKGARNSQAIKILLLKLLPHRSKLRALDVWSFCRFALGEQYSVITYKKKKREKKTHTHTRLTKHCSNNVHLFL